MKKVLILFSLLCLTSCGYQFQGGGSILPPDIKTIAIPLAENNTTEQGLDQKFTEALRSRFDRYGVVKVIDEESEADAVLIAKVNELETKVRGVTSSTDIELNSDLVLSVSAELKRKNGQILYKNNNLNISDDVAGVAGTVVTTSSDFSQGGISSDTLGALGRNAGEDAVTRGQQNQLIDSMLDEASRRIYLDAVAADF
ncbi:MAG: hypothetical protein KBC84_08715 [Proteobacteria bacterium]|nr:hypothetical protein [Pseudomonadota bacterium]